MFILFTKQHKYFFVFDNIQRTMSNNTNHSRGRLGNQIIRNTACSLLSKKYDLRFTYGYDSKMCELGIPLHYNGTKYHTKMFKLEDDDFPRFLCRDDLGEYNIYANDNFYQTSEAAMIYRDFYHSDEVKTSIMSINPFKERYNANNDVYVHIRLADAACWCPSFDYYDKVLGSLTFDNGYISTDDFEHELCQKLMSKYKLTPLRVMNEVTTIHFASTCKYVVLTNGTYGWFIGVIAWFSTVYFPNLDLREKFHGDIYVYPEWNKIDYVG